MNEKTHLLILEDDERASQLLMETLGRLAYDVATAASLPEAWESVKRRTPDVVLLDYHLSEQGDTGLDFYRKLQDDGYGFPAILITGFPDESLVLEALRAGVHDFVPKSPGYLDYLTAAIERVIRRVRAEQQLAESEELHRLTLSNVSDAVYITDEEGRFVYVCPNAYHCWGYSTDEIHALENIERLLGRQIYDEAELHRRREITNIEHTTEDKFGNQRHFLINVKQVAIRGGTRLFTCRDITDRKHVEEALHQERERCSRIVNTAPTMIVTTAPDGTTEFVNPAVTRITGYSPAELIGRNWWETLCPHADAAQLQDLARAADGNPVRDAEIALTTKEGDERTISWSLSSEDGQGANARVIAVGVDVTEQRRLEEQLRQAHKMEAVGRLAGGVAHDFNNLLTVILGNAALAQKTTADPELVDLLRDISEAAQRAGALTRQLLAFSQRQVLEPRIVDLNELITRGQRLCRRVMGEEIELVTRLESDLQRIQIDPGQIEQILLNLAVNARDAMPEGGQLTVATANLTLENARTAYKADVPPGDYVLLEVSDTGGGMSSEVKDRVFEPFFTTKGLGRGIGMGLAMVLGIVEQSRGYIAVESAPSQGTSFRIYFPVRESEEPTYVPQNPAEGRFRGIETVLLAEDEAGV